jgi:hypothetical protein
VTCRRPLIVKTGKPSKDFEHAETDRQWSQRQHQQQSTPSVRQYMPQQLEKKEEVSKASSPAQRDQALEAEAGGWPGRQRSGARGPAQGGLRG